MGWTIVDIETNCDHLYDLKRINSSLIVFFGERECFFNPSAALLIETSMPEIHCYRITVNTVDDHLARAGFLAAGDRDMMSASSLSATGRSDYLPDSSIVLT